MKHKYRCPICGGELKYQFDKGKMVCESCHQPCDPAALPRADGKGSFHTENGADGEETYMAEVAEDFEAFLYTCPVCGSEVIRTDGSEQTLCMYCGETTAMSKRQVRVKAPKKILPFHIDNTDCASRLSDLFSKALFVPRELKDREYLKKARPVYVPYWVYQVEQKGSLSLRGVRVYEKKRDRDECRMDFELDTEYTHIAFDATDTLPDDLSALLNPFQTFTMTDFHPAYLDGFYTQNPDVDPDLYVEDAKLAAIAHTYQSLNGRSSGEGRVYFKPPEGPGAYHTQHKSTQEALLPVWLLPRKEKNRVSYLAVNGSTGKAAGDIPVDMRRFLLFCLGLASGLAVVFYFLFGGMGNDLVLAMVASAAIGSMWVSHEGLVELYLRDTHAEDKGLLANIAARRPRKLERKFGWTLSPVTVQILVALLSFLVREMMDDPKGTTQFFSQYYRYGMAWFLVVYLVRMIRFRWFSLLRVIKKPRLTVLYILLAMSVNAAAAVIVVNPYSDVIYYTSMIVMAVLAFWLLLTVAVKLKRMTSRELSRTFLQQGREEA